MKSRLVILASESPRRRQLLARLLSHFEVLPSGVDESDDPAVEPGVLAVRLAIAKAQVVATRTTPALVLGADTLIDLAGRVLGKPSDREEALQMLRQLRGRVHRVVTGLCLLDSASGRYESLLISTGVRMRMSTEDVLLNYVESGEPLDKAGAYAIQGKGGDLIESIDGCFNNVVGLPLCETASLLSTFGVNGLPEPVCVDPEGRLCPHLRERAAAAYPSESERAE